jgi:hypothetical protein
MNARLITPLGIEPSIKLNILAMANSTAAAKINM